MLKARVENGLRAPALENKPEIPIHLAHVFVCYQDLWAEQHFSMAGGMGVPWRAVRDWCEVYGIRDEDDIDDLQMLLVVMASEHMKDSKKDTGAKKRDGIRVPEADRSFPGGRER